MERRKSSSLTKEQRLAIESGRKRRATDLPLPPAKIQKSNISLDKYPVNFKRFL
jgi:hypothetical protein